MKILLFTLLSIVIFGSVFLGAFYFFQNANIAQPKPSDQSLDYKPVTAEPKNLEFNISSPDDNKLVFKSDLLVSGKVSPDATVILSSSTTDQLVNTNKEGDFSTTVKLEEGVNYITIAALDQNGNIKKEVRTIYYSKEEL